MDYGQIPGIGKPVSRLIQGSMMISSADIDYSFALLDGLFEMGCTAVDMAHIYAGGDIERTVGRWARERGVLDRFVLITKGAHFNADRNRVTPFDIASDLYDSLARLQVDTIDLYLLHRDDPSVPVGPIVEALNEHKQAGRIRAFGGSNWSWQRIKEANDYALKHGLTPFAATSPNFSLAVQYEEPWPGCASISGPSHSDARDWYAQEQMPVLCWSSQAAGFFSGRFSRDKRDGFEEGSYEELCMRCFGRDDNFQRLDRATELAREKGVSPAQISMAWLMRQPMNLFALVGCRTPEEFRNNAEALDVSLTDTEAAWLNLEADNR